MSYDEIIQTLSSISARRETVTVTFPEGFSLMQIAQRMENNGLCTADEFIDVANNGDFSQFEFWSKIKEHDNKFMKAEGYLYPDTYFTRTTVSIIWFANSTKILRKEFPQLITLTGVWTK